MSKERLQEIKYRHAIGVETIPEELEWLISEVERLQAENEDVNGRVQRLSVKYKYERDTRVPALEQKVERLKKALETISQLTYSVRNAVVIAKQALETEGKE